MGILQLDTETNAPHSTSRPRVWTERAPGLRRTGVSQSGVVVDQGD